ncbi:MAG: hypothetical protein H7246_21580 [Phycisphaerae bacterium]|nr:hypothetical protein [Saprospiraceae bacterium]
MNKLVFSLLIGLLLTACQNTPKAAADAPLISPDVTKATAPATPTAPLVVSPDAVQEVTVNLTTGVKMAEDLRKQVDALPTNVRKANAAEIENMYGTLEGLIVKQTGMLNEIKASNNPAKASQESGAVGPSAAQMQEYTESAARYAQDAQAIQEAVRKMGGGNK